MVSKHSNRIHSGGNAGKIDFMGCETLINGAAVLVGDYYREILAVHGAAGKHDPILGRIGVDREVAIGIRLFDTRFYIRERRGGVGPATVDVSNRDFVVAVVGRKKGL
jgi:hypothetical protein